MSAIKTAYDPRPMPVIAAVRALDALSVEITWGGGTREGVEVVDLAPVINRYKAYKLIRDPKLFATVAVGNGGQILEWADGDFDMPATQIERLAEMQMTGNQFEEFLHRHAFTRNDAAAEFGRSLRCIQDYVGLKDSHIPRLMALTCHALEGRGLLIKDAGFECMTTLEATYNIQPPSNLPDYALIWANPSKMAKTG